MASISASSLIVSIGGPLSRSASDRSPASPRALDLQRAGQRVGVVLERDDALDGAGGGVGEHEAALDDAWGVRGMAQSFPTVLRISPPLEVPLRSNA